LRNTLVAIIVAFEIAAICPVLVSSGDAPPLTFRTVSIRITNVSEYAQSMSITMRGSNMLAKLSKEPIEYPGIQVYENGSIFLKSYPARDKVMRATVNVFHPGQDLVNLYELTPCTKGNNCYEDTNDGLFFRVHAVNVTQYAAQFICLNKAPPYQSKSLKPVFTGPAQEGEIYVDENGQINEYHFYLGFYPSLCMIPSTKSQYSKNVNIDDCSHDPDNCLKNTVPEMSSSVSIVADEIPRYEGNMSFVIEGKQLTVQLTWSVAQYPDIHVKKNGQISIKDYPTPGIVTMASISIFPPVQHNIRLWETSPCSEGRNCYENTGDGLHFRMHAVNVTKYAEELVCINQGSPHQSKTFKLVHSYPTQADEIYVDGNGQISEDHFLIGFHPTVCMIFSKNPVIRKQLLIDDCSQDLQNCLKNKASFTQQDKISLS